MVAFFRENGFHGLLAHDSEYALYNIPSYYSSHALKLSWNGKNLTTNQFLMQEVAKQLGLKRINFPIFAALLGRLSKPENPVFGKVSSCIDRMSRLEWFSLAVLGLLF